MRIRRNLHFTWQRFIAAALVLVALDGYTAEPVQRSVRVGLVHPYSPSTAPRGIAEFRERLGELGYVEGRNLVIEMRWADGRLEQLPGLLAEVVALRVDAIITWGTPAAIAAKNATSTIPIVAVAMGEPLRTGIATNLARPGGNLTGLSVGWGEGIAGKWLELLQETVPRLTTVAVIGNRDNAIASYLLMDLEATAPKRGLKLRLIQVREPSALDRAFEQAGREAQAAMVLPGNPLMLAHREQVVALAAKRRLPTIYSIRDYVEAGGLMTYAPDFVVMFQRAADYLDKILQGAKPGDLPIEQPTRFVLVINLKTAKALNLNMPESILLRAEVVR
jgi:putative ABC transport system substrate-binding protein